MYLSFLIILNKTITKFLKLLGRNASVYPGSIIYDHFDQKILTKIKYPKYVIAVSGSSGKGSATDLIAKILTANGQKVIYNQSGSNGVLGATTLILNNCDIHGNFKGDVLLFETDERHLKLIFTKNYPTHLILTNITRDQPVRNGHPKIVFDDMISNLNPLTHLIINADDPILNKLKMIHQGPITTFGVENTINSYHEPKLNAVDFAYCPICGTKLKYVFYHYGHLGKYHCPECDFKRGKLDYQVTDVDLPKKTIKINNQEIKINKDVLYAVYSTTAAYALTREINIPQAEIVKTINSNQQNVKRGQVQKLVNRDFIMLESKNENNLSYYQSLRYICDHPGHKSIIMGFENVSRRYKFNDLSWLYDVEFELLNNDLVDKIFCIGRFKYDVANRLAFANIDPKKIILIDEISNLLPQVKDKSKGTIFSIVCFDMTANIKQLLKEENHENN